MVFRPTTVESFLKQVDNARGSNLDTETYGEVHTWDLSAIQDTDWNNWTYDGYVISDITLYELIVIGITLSQLKIMGLTINKLNNFLSLESLTMNELGYSPGEFLYAGYTYSDLIDAGFTGSQIRQSWIQIGADIDGEAVDDNSGNSVSLNKDGTIVAIGAKGNSGSSENNNDDFGHVRVYQYNDGSWNQMGTDINGEAKYDQSGISVSLSDDGTIVAIGAPFNDGNGLDLSGHVRVYQFSDGSWNQLGQDIDGEANFDYLGYSVSLSKNGTRVAIGAYENDGNTGNENDNRGRVRVYQYSDSSWSQMGQDIDGEAADDQLGYSVDLSDDGTIVAIGAYYNDGNGNISGHVRVFEWNGTAWSPKGGVIDREDISDGSGYSVSLNSSGDIVAIGAPYNDGANRIDSGHVRVYQYDNGSWNKMGSDLDGEAAGDQSGRSVSLSSTGYTIAIGAPFNNGINGDTTDNRGHVRVYQWNGTAWGQLGTNIIGEGPRDQSGYSVSLSNNGKIVAIGAPYNDGNGSNFGRVSVYQYEIPASILKTAGATATQLKAAGFNASELKAAGFNASELINNGLFTAAELKAAGFTLLELFNAGIPYSEIIKAGFTGIQIKESWVQMGQDIDGEAAVDYSGKSVSLSSDGTIVAIGAFGNDDNGSGHVRVYNWNGSAWNQMGQDIDGETDGDQSGWSVSLSNNGSIVAIGAITNDGNSGDNYDKRGHVRVYQYDGTAWTQLGQDIDGEAAGDESGYSVSLSSDGTIVAIGAIYNSDNGSDSGHVRVYQYDNNTSSWVQMGSDIDGEADTNYSGYSVSLSSDGTIMAIGANWNDGIKGNFSGHVRVYEYKEFTQSMVDQYYYNNQTQDSGQQLPLIITSKDENGDYIAPISGNFYWTQLGTDIDGEAAGDDSGYSVSLSSDGYTVAIGAPFNDGNGNSSGHVRVYEWKTNADNNTSSWSQKGGDIDGEATGDWSGASVSLSSDGTIVAIGAITNDANGNLSGHVRLYQYKEFTQSMVDQYHYSDQTQNNDQTLSLIITSKNENGDYIEPTIGDFYWTQLGTDIDGEAAGDELGTSVSLSSDGSIVAIGAYNNDGNGSDSGHVRVYKSGIPVSILKAAGATATQLRDTGYTLAELKAGGYNASELKAAGFTALELLNAGFTYSDLIAGGFTGKQIKESWTQMGQDIDGEAAGDYSGWSVSLSSDGSIVAIGAYYNDGNGADSGHVRVYQYDGSAWVQMGNDIDGEAADDQSGISVSLSSDGLTVAIGAPGNDNNGLDLSGHVRVYQYDGSEWVQKGGDIDGEAASDNSGISVSLSSDGLTVAIGAINNEGNTGNSDDIRDIRGHVRVFKYKEFTQSMVDQYHYSDQRQNNDQTKSLIITSKDENGNYVEPLVGFSYWTQLGIDIDGEAYDDNSGWSVSLSSDGTIVAIGAIFNDGNGPNSGHVRVYEWKTNVDTNTSSWSQMGDDIDGEATFDYSGWSVSLSSDGTIVAIGARYNSESGTDSGHVSVYEWNGTAWVQMGTDIDGEATDDWSGYSVSLSSDGTIVAIGAPGNDGNGNASGHVRRYQYINGTAWIQMGNDIDGEAAFDYSGTSVSLSSDGNIVAIGASRNDGNVNASGHVRVYKYGLSASTLREAGATVRDLICLYNNSEILEAGYTIEQLTTPIFSLSELITPDVIKEDFIIASSIADFLID